MATMLSGTRAMMAAKVLRKEAEDCRKLSESESFKDFVNIPANLREQADWYDEVASALEQLDTYRRPILHVLDNTTGESE